MSEIKLEVGKTYLNRKGEEVRIIEYDGCPEFPYKGSNGEWFSESGRWQIFDKHPKDLIEEVAELPETCHAFITPDEAKKVTATRYTFAIPDGTSRVTVEQVGNRIVVEMVPEATPKPWILKEGDVVFEDGRIMIVKMHPNLYHAMFYPNYGNLFINGQYGIPFTSAAFRLATAEEAQLLFDALKKAGKRWNAETMQVEDVPEIERIREWMDMNIKCGGEVVDIAKVIEAYLKHKEGE